MKHNDKNGKAVIVFSGYNQRAVIAFLRTLESHCVKYAIVAAGSEDTIFQTTYRKKVLATRSLSELDLKDMQYCIDKVKTAIPKRSFVIAPSTEALNRFLLQHIDDFKVLGCQVPLVEMGLYESISDKYQFGRLCNQQGIKVPREYASLGEAELPFVAKPRTYQSANGGIYKPVLIHNKDDLSAFRQGYQVDDFYFQEFVEGYSLYLLYYFYQDGSVAKLSQENFVQQPQGRSIVAATTAHFHETAEAIRYEELFRSLGFTGLVMVEIRKGEGANYMIEANPRFWGPSQLFVDAGVNLFRAWLFDNGVLTDRPAFTNMAPAKYFWFGGIIETLRANDRLAYHHNESEGFSQTLADWMVADIYNREDTRELFVNEAGL